MLLDLPHVHIRSKEKNFIYRPTSSPILNPTTKISSRQQILSLISRP